MAGAIAHVHRPEMLRTDIETEVYFPFEFLSMINGYGNALWMRYGDYMKFVKGCPAHAYIIDTDRSYKEYQKEQQEKGFTHLRD